MEQIVTQSAFEDEHDFEAGEISGGVDLSTVGGFVIDQSQLGQLNIAIHDQRLFRVPLKDQIVSGVGHWKEKNINYSRCLSNSSGIALTTLHLQFALLCVVRIDEKVHGAGEAQRQLDHVEDRLVLVQPHVVIRHGHRLEGDRLGVLKERVRSPHILQPLDL